MDEEERILNKINLRRLSRVFMYAVLFVAGLIATRYPSRLVEDQVSSWVVVVWTIFMVLGAVVCLWGAVTDRWIGESVGLPLLVASLALYGLAALLSVTDQNIPLVIFGLILIAFAIALLDRWRDVQAIRENAGSE